MNGTVLGNDMILYFNVFALYPDWGNWFPAIASGNIDFGRADVTWYEGNEFEAT